jgi:hypothetical protein
MRRRLVGVWAVLLMLPALPVCAFYLIFADQNYFQLQNGARGIVATGPIAAYFGLVWLGWRIYNGISSVIPPMTQLEEDLVGTSWYFEATSFHGTHRTGTFRIRRENGSHLIFSGSFEDETGNSLGSWESTMTQCNEGRLKVVYALEVVVGQKSQHSTGMLTLNPFTKDGRQFKGNWVVLGQREANGGLHCWRAK